MPKKRSVKKADYESLLPELNVAFQKSRGNQVDSVEAAAALGEKWAEFKVALRVNGIAVREIEPLLDFTQQWGNRCEVLSKKMRDFHAAHDWYQQSGMGLGYRTKKNFGADYGLEVVKLHQLDRDGKGPPQPSKRAPKPKTSEHNLITSYQDKSERAIAELARVVDLFAATKEGRNFESPVLNELKAEQHVLGVKDDAEAGESDDEAAPSNDTE